MIHAIVPVKWLALAKGRLAGVLSPAERRALVLAMLGDVLAALAAAPGVARVGVVSPDAEALALAAELGAEPIADEAGDLNGALELAVGRYAGAAQGVLIVHADLPLLAPAEVELLIAALDGADVALAPSRDGGTNAIALRPGVGMPFLFGQDSLARHLDAARSRGLVARLVRAPGLERDLDRPDDLEWLAEAARA